MIVGLVTCNNVIKIHYPDNIYNTLYMAPVSNHFIMTYNYVY